MSNRSQYIKQIKEIVNRLKNIEQITEYKIDYIIYNRITELNRLYNIKYIIIY